ncbi:MAG: phytoene desaturase, partial [Mycobacteriaceae bacterium]|nr:phytoene desaturase [Mycobacteriaceae bacterium]
LDTVCGVFRAKGGVHQLPVALAAAAGKHGVDFRYNTTITGTERTRSGRVNAVVTAEGERIEADAVVFTCDPGLAYPLLGRPTPRLTYSPSCFLMLAGVAGPHGVGAHHNLHFGDAWRTTFDEIITQGKTMSDPSFLVTVSSHGDPTMAPAGKHSYYVQFPAPNTAASDLDWSTFAAPYRDHVVATLERRGYANIGSAIEFEEITTPLDWRRRGNPAGTPYNAAHTFWQTGPFRTSNLVGRNVVLAGAGTHPGIGVPMAMLSGKLAAARILGVDRA